jgi:hypothetical protein
MRYAVRGPYAQSLQRWDRLGDGGWELASLVSDQSARDSGKMLARSPGHR